MRSVGLKILKNKLSEYVRLAAGGETVLITDRDAVVAEIVPPRPGRSPMLADAWLAEAVRRGWITPPALVSDAAIPRKPIMPFRELAREHGGRSGRPVIYLDTSVALAQLLAEDRAPPSSLWGEPLIASRLLEYEIWTRLNARRLGQSHGEEARALIQRVALIELAPPVLGASP